MKEDMDSKAMVRWWEGPQECRNQVEVRRMSKQGAVAKPVIIFCHWKKVVSIQFLSKTYELENTR